MGEEGGETKHHCHLKYRGIKHKYRRRNIDCLDSLHDIPIL